jgi:hypothetical protein
MCPLVPGIALHAPILVHHVPIGVQCVVSDAPPLPLLVLDDGDAILSILAAGLVVDGVRSCFKPLNCVCSSIAELTAAGC